MEGDTDVAPTEKNGATTTNFSSNDSSKPFYVIAGTFKNTDYAKNRISELKTLGFSNAEVIQFDYPSYNAVCVDKFDSEQEARKLVESLNDNGIDSYVRKMD
ncbi:MAG: SPOR domain-containing protein [Saprospiraceae bacterium]|nr:SPOR domain-containing protein [Saprospiraceae bacterium]